jgi:hypothetical protein
MAQRLDAQGFAPTQPLSKRDTGKEAQPLGRQPLLPDRRELLRISGLVAAHLNLIGS